MSNKSIKKSIRPSPKLLNEVEKLMRNKKTKTKGIKQMTTILRLNNNNWNKNITMGKVRKAKEIISRRNNKTRINRPLKQKSKKTIKQKSKKPNPFGLIRRIGRSLKGPHAKVALELAVHPSKGISKYSRLPEKPPRRLWNSNMPNYPVY
jgi:hypothetical protein